jgi:hypothetical protein
VSFVPPRGLPAFGGLTPTTDVAALTSGASKTKLLEAVRAAHEMWRQQARFQNIIINGAVAVGPPGCLVGPPLEPLIRAAPGVVADQGAAKDLRDAVATGVSSCFASWQQTVTVPGLPWYPSFVAVAGPVAPPTPAIPAPLSLCAASAGMLGQQMLKQFILTALPQALRVAQVDACVGALAQSLQTFFSTWIATQQVVGVMGQGPVPSFAPPAVPVGSVVGGTVIPTPGHLALGGQPRMVVM